MSLPPYLETRLVQTEFPAGQRVLMISDIHGHATAFKKLLRRAAFGPKDTLVVVGDLLEKGTESLAVVRTLMDLSRTHRVYTLMGNMDVFTLGKLLTDDAEKRHTLFSYAPLMKNWWGGCLLMEMCREMGVPFTADMDEAETVRLIRAHFAPELHFLEWLPTILDTPDMTFVHGGVPHLRLHELAGKDCHAVLKLDDFLSSGLSFPKYVTVGHWPAVLYRDDLMDMSPLLCRERHILCLDGGCGVKKSGQLNCVIQPFPGSGDFSFVWEDDLPRVTALQDQRPSSDHTYIKFHDRQVTVLSRDDPDFALVSWHGKKVRVPVSALDFEHPGQLNTDITDYLLPVRAGDELSLIRTVAGRHYVRRDCILGWYCGPVAPAAESSVTPEHAL